MMKHKKGQAIFAGIMVAVMIFIVAVIFIEPIKDFVIIARNTDNLDCGNSSISTGNRLTCILVDMYLFYFFGILLAAAGSFVVGKRVNDLIR